jgi:putative glycosyltransferase (TIGR04372 family)
VILGKIVRFSGAHSIVPSLSWFGRYKKFRIAVMSTHRLGHLSLNTHLFFIRRKIGALENLQYLLISPSIKSKKIANVSLLLMFIAYSKKVENVRIICSSFLYFFFTFFQAEFRNSQLLFDLTFETKESEFSLGIKTVSFSEKQKKYGENILNRMPISPNKKIVTIFARDSSYLNNRYPKKNWSYHSYRDCDIETYIEAIRYLINKNYVVLRVGSEYSKKLNFVDENYFEYSLSDYKSAFMDLFIIYKSKFVIGSTSGATDVAVVFNVPYVGVNYAPFIESPLGKEDIFIQKKIINSKDEIVPYKNIISDSRYYLYDGNKMEHLYGLKYLDNSEEEILDATIEMDSVVNGDFVLNKNQKKLLEKYQNEYCQKNDWSNRFAPISINWLEKNYYLYLDDNIDLIGDSNVKSQ